MGLSTSQNALFLGQNSIYVLPYTFNLLTTRRLLNIGWSAYLWVRRTSGTSSDGPSLHGSIRRFVQIALFSRIISWVPALNRFSCEKSCRGAKASAKSQTSFRRSTQRIRDACLCNLLILFKGKGLQGRKQTVIRVANHLSDLRILGPVLG